MLPLGCYGCKGSLLVGFEIVFLGPSDKIVSIEDYLGVFSAFSLDV